ncbi:MAG: hypothetical protein V9E94_04600 [Microthrixaceae bacterium]
MGAALLAHAGMWVCDRRWPVLSLRHSLVLVGLVLAVVAVLPLHHSRDLFLYDIYGRAVVEHRVSPYTTAPSELGDPTVDLVAGEVARADLDVRPRVRGSGIDRVLGRRGIRTARSACRGRSSQLHAPWLRSCSSRGGTRDPMAAMALGCSPVMLATVNDAHNDVLLGLAILVVVLLVDDRRYVFAGGVAAIAVAMKVPAAVPIAAVAAWVLWRRGWRPAMWFSVPLFAAVTTAYLAVGGSEAMRPLRESSGDDSRFAIWQPLRDARFEQLLEDGVRWRVALDTVRDQMSTYALALLVIALAVAIWRFRRAGHPGEVAGIAGVVLMITSTYVMPWYPAMVLPVVALAWTSRTSRVAQVQAGFLLLAYAERPGNDPTTWLGTLLEQRAVWVNLAFLVAALWWCRPAHVDEHTPAFLAAWRSDAAIASDE